MSIPLFNSGELRRLVHEGSPVLFPTDTLPALATIPENADDLWNLKNRPRTKPFILMASSSEELFDFILPEALEDASKIGSVYWPGALTMVLPAMGSIVESLNPFGSSIGMRIPDCDLAIDFLEKSGPLATTSANLSGYEPLVSAMEISKTFPKTPLLGPIPWPLPSGLASTLIKWKGKGRWETLRKGSVSPFAI